MGPFEMDTLIAGVQGAGMTKPILSPDQCQTMTDVRASVDALDAELVTLLARRFAYMRAAARIKPDAAMVRDEARKAAVITAAVDTAAAQNLPTDVIAAMWEVLVEGSIAYEAQEWARIRAT